MAGIIEIHRLSKRFDQQLILDDISLTVNDGEFLTLLGPSGCGKTTLLRLISGFESCDSGQIFIRDKNVTQLTPQQRDVHTVFQSYALFPHMTVFENVAFGLRCSKVSTTEIKARVENILAMVQLSDFSNRKPHQLSGGQQQRVAIARAVVNEPLVLLLDESLSSLDQQLRQSMQIELKRLQRQLGITFIFVTHDQEEALAMSDRIVIMQDGHIIQVGTPREVYEEPANLTAARFIGQLNIFTSRINEVTENQIHYSIEHIERRCKNVKQLKKADPINVLVRPEDLRVWGEHELDPTDHMLPGTIDEVIYKGSTVDLIVRLKSGRLIYATEFFDEDDENLFYNKGESVWVNWLENWEVILIDESA